ncbi:MAG: GTP cyclohydrolase I [Deltaproteobacteria bacterium]|nr:GTP cyclohydrolase I [Deltaproteobacteria bacterium]
MKRNGLEGLLGELGYLDDPECTDTAARFAEVLREYAPRGAPPKLDTFVAPGRDRVVFRDLPFHSLCAHHLLPFHGQADVAYLPGAWGRIAGLGGVARALKHLSRQPQLQERLGAQLADHLHAELGGPVAVRLRARQMCMEMRGAESAGLIETLALRGEASEGLLG